METKKDMKTTEIVIKHQYGIICFFSGFIMGVILSVIIAYSLPSSCQNADIHSPSATNLTLTTVHPSSPISFLNNATLVGSKLLNDYMKNFVQSRIVNGDIGSQRMQDQNDAVMTKDIKDIPDQNDIMTKDMKEIPATFCDDPVTATNCKTGIKIFRGSDWEDGAVDHSNGHPGYGYVDQCLEFMYARVTWDGGNKGRYRIGNNGKHELCVFKRQTERLTPDTSKCLTSAGGPNVNTLCVFPFRYGRNGTLFHGCTTKGNREGDLKRWCSTKVDFRGVHIGGKGNWGICGNDCPSDEIDTNIHFRIKD